MNYKSVLEEQIRELQKVHDDLMTRKAGNEINIIEVSAEIRHLIELAKRLK